VGLFIVAGPGTGKTATLTLRILKRVLVDGVPPRSVLATTFTKKAAKELRSRVLGWGFQIIGALKNDPTLTPQQKAFVDAVDINQVRTGTVDSLCEQLLREFRAPGTQPPVLVDEFVSKTLMLRGGLFGARSDQSPALDAFLLSLYSDNGKRFNHPATLNSFRSCLKVIDTFRGLSSPRAVRPPTTPPGSWSMTLSRPMRRP